MKKIFKMIFTYDKLALILSNVVLSISILMIFFVGGSRSLGIDKFNQFNGSILTVASIFLGMYGAIIGLIFSSEMGKIIDAVKNYDMYKNFQYRIWSALVSSAVVIVFCMGVQLVSLIVPMSDLSQKAVLCVLVFLTVYFLTSVFTSLQFLISAILFELGL